MITWKEGNLFTLNEEENSKTYLDDLKKLINGEAACAIQYKIASKIIIGGPDQDYLASHFAAHADEEWDHYDQLVDALMERTGTADKEISNILENALPATKELEEDNADYLKEFFIEAEDNAIKAYEDFYGEIEDIDADLADIVSGIISEEREHKLDFVRL